MQLQSCRYSIPTPYPAQGLALTDMNGIPPVIWHFPAGELPQEPTARYWSQFGDMYIKCTIFVGMNAYIFASKVQ